MKADPSEQLLLLQVQEFDTKLDQLQHGINVLPQHALIEAIDTKSPGLKSELQALEVEAGQVRKAAERIDVDVEQVRSRVSRDEAALASGALGAKELEAMQHELTSLGRRQNELEEEELEVLQQLEDLQARVTAISAELASLERQRAVLVTARDVEIARYQGESEQIRIQREALAAGVSPEVLTYYEKVRLGHSGVGAAALRGGACEGCQLQIPPSERNRVMGLPADALPSCEECGRILIRVS
jgi:predicted  nucleic acid-binding Zn-ribbon protein